MNKWKSVTLLAIVSAILAVALVMTFLSFSYNSNGMDTYQSMIGSISLGYDIDGGSAYTLTLADDNEEDVTDINKVVSTLKDRLNILGYTNANVVVLKDTTSGVEDYDIRIETATNDSLASDIEAVTAYGVVKFFGGTSENPSSDASAEIVMSKNAIANASYVGQVSDGAQTYYQSKIDFTNYGYDTIIADLEAKASDSSAYYLEITLGETAEGTPNVIFSSQLNKSYFEGKSLTLSSTQEDGEATAKRTVLQLKTGGLAYKYTVTSTKISPLFGEGTATAILIALIALFGISAIALIVVFKGYGLIGALSLVTFFVAMAGLLVAVPGIIVSVPSIVGIVFAMLLVVDGTVITIKRIKEEFAKDKTVKASIKTGMKRAFIPTISISVVSVIIALALFALTSGALNSFAITLGIGSALAFICNVLISKMFLTLILPLTKNADKFLNLKRVDK